MSDTTFAEHERREIQQARIWPRLLAFPILAIGGQIAFLAGLGGDFWLVQATWVVVLTYCWFCIGGLLHELNHQTLPISRETSVRLGKMIGTFLGLPYSVYRAVHIRHHAYLNTPLDWELWPYCDPRCAVWFRRAFVWFDILFGVIATPLIYQRISTSKDSPVPIAERRQMRKEYVYVLAFWLTVLVSIGALALTNIIQLDVSVCVRLAPLWLAASMNSTRKLVEHLGLASYDPVAGTRTIIGQHWWTRCLSYFDFELSIHGPHHRYPKCSHHQLEMTMRQIEERHPDRKYPVFQSVHAAVLDVLPWLFRNPGVGINVGNTESLTHLPNIDNYVTDALCDIVTPASIASSQSATTPNNNAP